VPDVYQGAEFWDQSLVDPDNRRPVDFARRIDALEDDATPVELMPHWQDGKVKQAVIRHALALRREVPDLFARGEYRPVEVRGPRAPHVVAFVRSRADAHCLVVVPLHCCHCEEQSDEAVWHDTTLHLPPDLAGRTMRDRICGTRLEVRDRHMPVASVLARFPVALLATE
jgi:(1->4)-alpha-D-glucan 1-alpha-D-glucosylmutase